MSNGELEVSGSAVGSPRCIVVYYDVNANKLYSENGKLYGSKPLSVCLGNRFILELHYVQDISIDKNPDEWDTWNELSGMSVFSTLSFDDNYIHALKGTVVENANIGATTVKIKVLKADKDVLGFSGNLVFNPFGIDAEEAEENETHPIKQTVFYSSFAYISDDVFEFTVEALPLSVYGGTDATPVRVADPLYLFVTANDIYESNIPARYNEGIFKIPIDVNSRKLLKAMDYSGVSGIIGKMEHKIYTDRNVLSGITISGNSFSRAQDKDENAVDSSDGETYTFCAWSSDSTSYWTRGNAVEEGASLYTVSNGTASLAGVNASPVFITVPMLFRTFSFPFVVQNLVDF